MSSKSLLLTILFSLVLGPSVHAGESTLPSVTVYKNASCGCCRLWVQHLVRAGFTVQVKSVQNLNPVKQRVSVPAGLGSCHTAEVGGYFVEGHVPAQDIQRLLREHPRAKGLVLPGMPAGSPGMEVASGKAQPHDVQLVAHDGKTSVFARHGAK